MMRIDIIVGTFFVFFLLGVLSCSDNHEEDKSLILSTNRVWYYSDSTLKKLIQLDENGRETGVYKFYYPNGVLKDSAILIDGRFNGNRFLFHPNGNLYKKTNYINHRFREGITYDSMGTLSYYRAYDHLENLMFISRYDKNGRTKMIDGNFMYGCILNDTIKDVQNFELLVATPPKSEVVISVYESFDGKLPESAKYKVKPDQFNRVQYKIHHFAKSNVSYINIASVYDSTIGRYFTDTCIVRIMESSKTSFEKSIFSQSFP